ncbi:MULTISPECIES: CcdB family protein [Rhizobium]|uniref:CcdB family protein n=1 Tax=Rhizobium TaxID=379 RepID=UPI000BE93624|nr:MULTISPECIES: CcdB family protein [Rhizobium]MBB3521943.1 toxin CcdB [Rhizobium sp. BK456]MBY4588423.1 CcdB family protein [Rhizobium redzepovicii]MBY4614621.1 CcdB family protein [Rhizobium redzepovicii]MDF0660252.1 CcdB family protein [Rhizobium sp. BC49]MDR9780164.1 CcdB family protein [Rhizobium redzepovicii]
MARFHVYNLIHTNALALDLQSDLHGDLTTRIMAPMLPLEALPKIMRQLNPQFVINGVPYVMATQFIGAISVKEIGVAAADLTADSDRIISALDFLFQGF